jgi:hypothetical protein
MPVTYTITSGDVASVSGTSLLTAGVVFDWTNQKIYIPSGVAQVNAQFAIDNCRFAEGLFPGLARPQIIVGGGALQIAIDPDTLAPIRTPTVAIFQDEWRIVTEKTSGIFVVRDIYANLDASTPIPYDDVPGVFIQYLTSVTGAVATVTTGSGLDAGQSAALTAIATLSARLDAMLEDAGSYDRWLDTALEEAPVGAGGGSFDAQDIADALLLEPAAGTPAAGSVYADLDEIKAIATAAKNNAAANL